MYASRGCVPATPRGPAMPATFKYARTIARGITSKANATARDIVASALLVSKVSLPIFFYPEMFNIVKNTCQNKKNSSCEKVKKRSMNFFHRGAYMCEQFFYQFNYFQLDLIKRQIDILEELKSRLQYIYE